MNSLILFFCQIIIFIILNSHDHNCNCLNISNNTKNLESQIRQDFEKFQINFDINYDKDEILYRFENFKSNYDRLIRFKSRNITNIIGITKV